ncbi:CU044_5270 family protein [Streptomyces cuspidosporus]|uniref:CU044_5270 family protein n=1 Tax=Streptomyces cuspidosporus TaxID=66882 RepID=A0ABN3G4E0_9ACTN
MDEITAVRALREDAPAPDRARLATGRQALLNAAARGTRARRLRADWRLASLGAAAAVAAAALVATQLGPQAGGGGQEGPRLRNAAAVLENAAHTVEDNEQGKAGEPRPHQWIYTKWAREGLLVGQTTAGRTTAENPKDPEPKPGETVEYEEWVRYDGEKLANADPADPQRVVVHDVRGERTPRQWYRLLASLPTEPDELLKALREKIVTRPEGNTQAERDFTGVRVLLGSAPLFPPDVQAALYRALATIPGVEVGDHLVKDAAGRDAIAVTHTDVDVADGPVFRHELLLDPQTYAYLGYRMVAAKDYTYPLPKVPSRVDIGEAPDGGDPIQVDKGQKVPKAGKGRKVTRVEKGQLMVNEARVTTTVVDRAGDR